MTACFDVVAEVLSAAPKKALESIVVLDRPVSCAFCLNDSRKCVSFAQWRFENGHTNERSPAGSANKV